MSENEIPISTIFGRNSRFINDMLENRFSKERLNMTIVEFALLYRLSVISEDEITQQHFANLEGKHKSVILKQINLMEQKGWVLRVDDVSDKRKNMVSLTRKGVGALNKALKIEQDLMDNLVSGLNTNDIITFKKVALQIQIRLAALVTVTSKVGSNK
jgi:DNA-binding MarR family transcriptional regulator